MGNGFERGPGGWGQVGSNSGRSVMSRGGMQRKGDVKRARLKDGSEAGLGPRWVAVAQGKPMGLIGIPDQGFWMEGAFFEFGFHEFGGERAKCDTVLVVVPTVGVDESGGGGGSFHWLVAWFGQELLVPMARLEPGKRLVCGKFPVFQFWILLCYVNLLGVPKILIKSGDSEHLSCNVMRPENAQGFHGSGVARNQLTAKT